MVQLSIIAIALTSALSGLVAAKSCKTGGIYCGTSLLDRGKLWFSQTNWFLHKNFVSRANTETPLNWLFQFTGNYITNINTGLAAQSVPETEFNQHNSLWDCTHNGQIQFSTLCLMGCLANGSDDDTCQVDTAKRDAIDKEWVAWTMYDYAKLWAGWWESGQ
jgi:hypothetical protein